MMAEASVTALLSHPSIPPVLDAGEDADGPFYTMPILDAPTLQQRLSAGDLSLNDAVRAVSTWARALASAHGAGVVHRDVKPANLLVARDGSAWVVDWGVALDPRNPRHGQVGTLGYQAPELAAGQPADGRADVYSLGRVVDAVLEGLDADDAELETVVGQATAEDPDERYASMTAFADELDRWLDGRRLRGHAYTAREVVQRWLMEHVVSVSLGGLTIVALLGMASWSYSARTVDWRRAENALADSLALRATAARVDGQRREAERLALDVLVHRDDPIARGVLMRWPAGSRPQLVARQSLPCSQPQVLHDGTLLCLEADAAARYVDGEEVGRWPAVGVLDARHVDGVLYVVDRAGMSVFGPDSVTRTFARGSMTFTDDVEPTLFGLQDLAARPGFDQALSVRGPCRDEIVDVAVQGESRAIACRNKMIHVFLDGENLVLDTPDVASVAFTNNGQLVLGTFSGQVGRWDGDQIVWSTSPVGPVRALQRWTGSELLIVGERGGLARWQSETGVVHEVFASGVLGIAVQDGLLVVAREGAREVWRLPAARPVRYPALGGITGMSVSPDGAHLVTGYPSGAVHHTALESGRTTILVDSGIRSAQAVWAGNDGEVAYPEGVNWAYRASLSSEPVVHPGVYRTLHRWRTGWLESGWDAARYFDGEVRVPCVVSAFRADVEPRGLLFTLARSGAVLRQSTCSDAVEVLGSGEFRSIAASEDRLYAGTLDGLSAYTHDGTHLWTVPIPRRPMALAASEQVVAVGTRDGDVRVYDRQGKLAANVPNAHRRRVTWLAIRGDALYSAGFGDSVRVWDLAVLDRPVSELLDEARRDGLLDVTDGR